MANCNHLLKEFHSKIDLSSTKKETLRISRNAVRKRIENYFTDNLDETKPRFHMQGSFKIGTVINPLDEEYDIDDGVYLQNLPDNKNEWPSTETVHKWIYKAVENYNTKEKPINKNNCVRVVYSNKYHIDLPIYGKYNSNTYLAVRGNQNKWIESDPIEFNEWFLNKVKSSDEQLRRVIQYMKAFKDYKSLDFPSIGITILASENFIFSPGRDDISMHKTSREILHHLFSKKFIIKPVKPFDNVLENTTSTELQKFLDALEKFCTDTKNAIEYDETELNRASEIWEKHLGDRFPIAHVKKIIKNENITPTVLTSTISPWGIDDLV